MIKDLWCNPVLAAQNLGLCLAYTRNQDDARPRRVSRERIILISNISIDNVLRPVTCKNINNYGKANIAVRLHYAVFKTPLAHT